MEAAKPLVTAGFLAPWEQRETQRDRETERQRQSEKGPFPDLLVLLPNAFHFAQTPIRLYAPTNMLPTLGTRLQ